MQDLCLPENNRGYRCVSRHEKCDYAQTYNNHRIMGAEKETSDASKLARSSRRAEKLSENYVFEETESLLYAPGIAD